MGTGGYYLTIQYTHLFAFMAKVNNLYSFTVNTKYEFGGTFKSLVLRNR